MLAAQVIESLIVTNNVFIHLPNPEQSAMDQKPTVIHYANKFTLQQPKNFSRTSSHKLFAFHFGYTRQNKTNYLSRLQVKNLALA